MKITAVQLKHTNPSMGPHERIITFTLHNTAAHEAEFEQLLNASTVNGTCPLSQYLTYHQQNNQVAIQQVLAQHEDQMLSCGATISTFSLTLNDGKQVSFYDLRTIDLRGYYGTFIPYLVKHGTRDERGNASFQKEPFLEQPLPFLPDSYEDE